MNKGDKVRLVESVQFLYSQAGATLSLTPEAVGEITEIWKDPLMADGRVKFSLAPGIEIEFGISLSKLQPAEKK